jgi:hypothetical protein
MLTLFGCLHATREDLLWLLRRPRVLVLSLMAMFVVMVEGEAFLVGAVCKCEV